MYSQQIINDFMDSFVSIGSGITAEKVNVLETFRATEVKLKDYSESLNDLEKQQNKINLIEFGGLRSKTVEILSVFDPINIESNISKIYETIDFFKNIENELIEVSESLLNIRRSWNLFIIKNDEFKDSIFDKYVNDKEQKLKDTLNIINPREIGILSIDIEKTRQEVELIISYISKIKDLLLMNIFIGEDSKKIENEISMLMSDYHNNDIHNFIDKSKELIKKVEEINTSGKKGVVAVEVVKYSNKDNKSIFKHTLKFGDHIMKYDTFFNIDNPHIVNTGKYVFLDNFPLDGVFKGRDIIESLDYNDNYISAVEDFSNSATYMFTMLITLIFITTTASLFIGGIAIYLNFILALAGIIGFNPYLSALQISSASKFGLKKIFIYSTTNFIVASKGSDTDMNAVLLGIMKDFDNTILNEKFHNEGSTY